MIVVPINPRLVRVDEPHQERYVERTALGFWINAKTGRAVCPVTVAAIEKAVRHA